MSSQQTDDEKKYVQSSPPAPGAGTATVTTRQAPATAAEAPSSQRNETIVTHRSTNEGAIATLVVGILVLVGGIALIESQIRFLPWPYSIIVVLGFGLVLLLVGASFIDRGATRP